MAQLQQYMIASMRVQTLLKETAAGTTTDDEVTAVYVL